MKEKNRIQALSMFGDILRKTLIDRLEGSDSDAGCSVKSILNMFLACKTEETSKRIKFDTNFLKPPHELVKECIEFYEKQHLSYDDLVVSAANFKAVAEILDIQNKINEKAANDAYLALAALLIPPEEIQRSSSVDVLRELAKKGSNAAQISLLGFRTLKRAQAKKGAQRKLANDPKQKEKEFVHECWKEWQAAPNPKKIYSGKAAFARDMLDKCEHLASQKKIEDWCRAWEKESSTQLAE